MTNPILSINTTEEIGRLYQLPGGEYASKISSKAARKGLQEGTLFPSITNIISAINPKMEGYVAFKIGEGLRQGLELKVALVNHITFRDAAADRGTRIHAFIEDFINEGNTFESYRTFTKWKQLDSYQQLVEHDAEFNDLTYLNGFFTFLELYKPVFLHQEATVYGTTLEGQKYAGTTDFIALIDGKTVVGDWKTSSKMSGTIALQLSAAQYAEKMTTDFETLVDVPPIEEGWGVHLEKTGGLNVHKSVDSAHSFEMFSAARTLWDFYINKKAMLEVLEPF